MRTHSLLYILCYCYTNCFKRLKFQNNLLNMEMNGKEITELQTREESGINDCPTSSETCYGSAKLQLRDDNNENNNCCKLWQKIPFSGKQLIVILLLCYGNFCVGSAYSLLAPFFPVEVISISFNSYWFGWTQMF